MAIRATIVVVKSENTATLTVQQLVAQCSYIKPSASISYPKNEAIAYINENSKNKWIYEEIPLSDLFVNYVNKSIFDETELVDHFTNAFGLTKEDSTEFIENFSRVAHFRRNFEHAFTLDDSALIDKDFYGNKGNIFDFDDIYAASLGKGVSDDFSLGEEFARVVQFYREFSHSVEFTELYSADVQKSITDTLDGVADETVNLTDTIEIEVFSGISRLVGGGMVNTHTIG
jgi:hypothetical protein